jgi:hypothetical protein
VIRIVLENGNELEYTSGEDLGISLNRIVDDFNQPDKRFGEFSYTFKLPRTKNNDLVWEFPDVRGRERIFTGKQFNCKLFSNGHFLLDAIIELTSVEPDHYGCNFYSKYTQLLDDIKGKKLVDMTALPTIPWEYEKTIVDQIRENLADADETDYQFPLSFYRTPYISGFTETTKFENYLGYTYNYVESFLAFSQENPLYYTAFPPAIYLKSILKGMLKDAGWTLGGSFFQGEDICKIILLYTGDPEIYSGAISTGVTNTLNLNKVLPELSQIDFLKSVINMFNLYFTIDTENRIISFEAEPVLFSDNSNAVDITNKIDASTIIKSKASVEPNITFASDDCNDLACGYGRTFSYTIGADRVNPTYFLNPNTDIRATTGQGEISATYSKNAFDNLWNSNVGSSQTIKLAFSPCNYFPYAIINEKTDDNVANTSTYVDSYTIGIPLISPQTPNDNDGYFFDEVDSGLNNCTANAATEVQYVGGVKLAYYYGLNSYNLSVGTKDYHQFLWVGIATGGTCEIPTFARVTVPVASPYKLISIEDKNKLLARIDTFNSSNPEILKRFNELGAEAHNLLLLHQSMALSGTSYATTRFSLTMGSNPENFADNLYSYFYQKKFELLRNGYLMTATIVMNEFDWHSMQINTPLLYNGEYFRLVGIRNFNPIKATAQITMLKK